MKKVVIVAAKRTAIGNFNGKLAGVHAHDLGAACIQAIMKDTGLKPEQIDEVIMGQILTAGAGQNPARQASLKAGLSISTPVLSINKLCGSGMKSVHLAYQSIVTGEANIIIAGGQENMSLAPHLLMGSRKGTIMGDWVMKDSMMVDGLTCAIHNYGMGITAENIAEKYGISREEQDEFSVNSQHKASKAQKDGKFDSEIIPVNIPQRKGDPLTVDKDEFIRHDASIEGLAKLRAVFKKDGTVTAGNASGINDGAAALVVMGEDTAKTLGLKPLAYIKALGIAGVDPAIMGTGPIPATKNCLKKAGWTVDNLDVIESNEAFAAQAISVNRDLKWDLSKVNVNGGAIALGHPIGGSGARILTTLLHEMIRQDAKKGLATMCIGGGQGIATAVERI